VVRTSKIGINSWTEGSNLFLVTTYFYPHIFVIVRITTVIPETS